MAPGFGLPASGDGRVGSSEGRTSQLAGSLGGLGQYRGRGGLGAHVHKSIVFIGNQSRVNDRASYWQQGWLV